MRTTRTIGLVLPPAPGDLQLNSFFISSMRGIGTCARSRDYFLLCSIARDEADERRIISGYIGGRLVDGVVLMTVRDNDHVVELINERRFPCAVIGRPEDAESLLWVDNDNFHAMYRVVNDLLDQGHRRIAFVGTAWHENYTKDRYQGYLMAIHNRGLTLNPELVPISPERAAGLEVPAAGLPAHNSEEIGYAAMSSLLDAQKPDAVVATDDLLAFGVLRAADERGLTEIAVAGFNNSVRAAYQRPSLTSVEIHPEELGYQAAHLLIASLQGDPQQLNHRIIETSVIHRDTTMLRERR